PQRFIRCYSRCVRLGSEAVRRISAGSVHAGVPDPKPGWARTSECQSGLRGKLEAGNARGRLGSPGFCGWSLPVLEKRGILGHFGQAAGRRDDTIWRDGMALAVDVVTSPFRLHNVRLDNP